jgi:hypothetical protein
MVARRLNPWSALVPLDLRVLALMWLALPAAAAPDEAGPRTPACRSAVAALEQAEDTLASHAASAPQRPRAANVAARLQPLRQRVADACLGGMTTSPPPSQRTWLPPAPTARAQPARPRVATPTPPPLDLPRPAPPVTITHCTPATCVTSDGATLTRAGAGLIGTKGRCTVQGMFVNCP